MKLKSKVVQIPSNATIAQMENALNTHLNNGWVLVTIFALGTNTYAVLTKIIVN